MAFSTDGNTLVSGGGDLTIQLWDITSLAEPHKINELKEHTGFIWSLAFSPDGETLASAGSTDNTVILWDVSNPSSVSQRGEPLSLTGTVYSVAFSFRREDACNNKLRNA